MQVFSSIEGQRGEGGGAGCVLRVVFSVRYGKLASTLESISGELPRPRIDRERRKTVAILMRRVTGKRSSRVVVVCFIRMTSCRRSAHSL